MLLKNTIQTYGLILKNLLKKLNFWPSLSIGSGIASVSQPSFIIFNAPRHDKKNSFFVITLFFKVSLL